MVTEATIAYSDRRGFQVARWLSPTAAAGNSADRAEAVGRRPRVRGTPLRVAAARRVPRLTRSRQHAAERWRRAMPGAHRHGPKIMASHSPTAKELVGSEEAGCSSTLHQCDREVAPNAVAGQHDPRVRRLNGEPLVPGIECHAAGSRY